MLYDLIEKLAHAMTEKEKERAFKELESVGMDRATAMKILEDWD